MIFVCKSITFALRDGVHFARFDVIRGNDCDCCRCQDMVCQMRNESCSTV